MIGYIICAHLVFGLILDSKIWGLERLKLAYIFGGFSATRGGGNREEKCGRDDGVLFLPTCNCPMFSLDQNLPTIKTQKLHATSQFLSVPLYFFFFFLQDFCQVWNIENYRIWSQIILFWGTCYLLPFLLWNHFLSLVVFAVYVEFL